MNVSIVVCTHNRGRHLSGLFESLTRLVVPSDVDWELVVVDNASTDNTRDICHAFAAGCQKRCRYVHEPNKGKSIALNTGISHADGDIIAFTDDDCVLSADWLLVLAQEFNADPSLGVLGGRVKLYDSRDQPLTLTSGDRRVVYSSLRMLFPDPLIIGCNMAARKEVFCSVEPFDTRLGPGTEAIAEDVDFIHCAHKAGVKVAYVPNLVVYHNHGRQTDEEVRALVYKYHVGRGAFYVKHILRADADAARMASRDCWTSLKRAVALRGARSEMAFLRALWSGALVIAFGNRR